MPKSRFLDDLPETLAYLKRPAEDIAAQDVELLGCGEADLTTFENALRLEMTGLSAAEAEIRCSQHQQLLQDWLSRRESLTDPYILALSFLVGPLAAAYEVVSPYGDDDDFLAPTFRPRMVQLDHPEQFSTNHRANDTIVTDGSAELLIREIDERSYNNLREDFSRPRRKTTTPDGATVHPQSNITLSKVAGTKNVVENKNERVRKQATYFLKLKDGFVMVRLMLREIDTDETVFEAMLDSITFT